jgi:hypothetical protein
MFKLAVLGPIVTGGIGVARQCVDCQRWRPAYDGDACFGFGPGCLENRPQAREDTVDRAGDELHRFHGPLGSARA